MRGALWILGLRVRIRRSFRSETARSPKIETRVPSAQNCGTWHDWPPAAGR